MRTMTLSNRAITLLTIAPGAIYVTALGSLMATRLLSGMDPLPNGTTPVVIGLSAVIPIASIAFGTVLRLRRDAKGS